MLSILENYLKDSIDLLSNNNYTIPRVNILEKEDLFLIEVELPGVSKKDINITYEDDVLEISTNKIQGNDQEYNIKEINYGEIKRVIDFSNNKINKETIIANLKNGILEVKLEKDKTASEKYTVKIN